MPLLDRTEVLARTDLAELADDVCGPPRGRGRSARWHCPSPSHPDQNPSMGIFTSRSGLPRWKCHSCGEGGTAVDLLMITQGMGAGDALKALADRAGISPASTTRSRDIPSHNPDPASPSGPWMSSTPHLRGASDRQPWTRPGVQQTSAFEGEPDPAVEALVSVSAELLWQPIGSLARRRLAERGFPDELLRANRVGFDPGPQLLPRPEGLPWWGPGIVFPALHPDTGNAIYYQVRSLSPRVAARRKYDQPTAELATNPRLVAVRGIAADILDVANGALSSPRAWAICEGFPDAYTATLAGLPGLALLGVSHASADGVDDLARKIITDHPAPTYAVCFDNEPVATTFAYRLADRLARRGATAARLQPPAGHKDLNAWWQAAPDAVISQLTGGLPNAGYGLRPHEAVVDLQI